jgi:quinol monooxygenase YgiN
VTKVSAITTLVAKPGRFAELQRAADEMVAAVRNESGTEIYAVSRATNAENTLFVYELFSDRAAFRAHAAAGEGVSQLLAPLVDRVEIVLGEPLAEKPADQGSRPA